MFFLAFLGVVYKRNDVYNNSEILACYWLLI